MHPTPSNVHLVSIVTQWQILTSTWATGAVPCKLPLVSDRRGGHHRDPMPVLTSPFIYTFRASHLLAPATSLYVQV